MYEVYFVVDGDRNEEPEMIFGSYDKAMDYVLAEQDKYSEDSYFEIYDVNADRWY
jgi:hypothetical protein